MPKLCSACGASKDESEFSKNRSKADGLNHRCRPCDSAHNKAWYAANKGRRAETQKAWTQANRAAVCAASARYRERHPDVVAAYQATAAEYQREYHKTWYAKNLDAKREKNRQWAKKNPAKHAALCARRRCAELKRTPAWADNAAIKAVYAEAKRMSEVTGTPHEVDHFYPIQGEFVSGLHVQGNLRVIPMIENRSKSNKVVSAEGGA